MIILCHNIKDKRIIILYAVAISLWLMLGKEIWYFYAGHPKNNDCWIIYSYSLSFPLLLSLSIYLSLYHISLCFRHHCVCCVCFISPFRRFFAELKELCVSVITVSLSLSLLSIFLSGVSNGRFVLVFLNITDVFHVKD